MKKVWTGLLVLSTMVLSQGIVYAQTWISPIDKKYQSSHPELYKKYDEARSHLDSYRGNQEDLIAAKTLLDSVIQNRKDFSPAYREYGRLYIKAGHISSQRFQPGTLSNAESAILESIRLEPNYADAYVLLGHLYTLNKKYKDAEEALNKAGNIGTELPWYHLNYADLLKYQGRMKESLPHYMAVIESDTENKNAYDYALLGVALHYRSTGMYDKADFWYNKLIEFNPTAWNLGEYTKYLLFWTGDIDKSILYGEKSLSVMNYGLGRFNLACAYYAKWAKSSGQDASELFNRAYMLYPDTDRVIQMLSRYPATREAAIKLENSKGTLSQNG